MPAKDRTETVETDVKAATDAITLRFGVAHVVLYTTPKIKLGIYYLSQGTELTPMVVVCCQ